MWGGLYAVVRAMFGRNVCDHSVGIEDHRYRLPLHAAAFVRLLTLFFETLGGDSFNASSYLDGGTLAAVLKEQVRADAARILVVDGDSGLAACGIGTIARRLPGRIGTDT